MPAEAARLEAAETLVIRWHERLGLPGWPGKTPWRTTVKPIPYRHVSKLATGRTSPPPAPKAEYVLLLPPDWMPASEDQVAPVDLPRLNEIREAWADQWQPLHLPTATGRQLDLIWAALQAWEQQHQGTRRGLTARRLRLDMVEAEANRRWKTTEDLNLPESAAA
jgi:hypothetical protein